MYDEAHMTVSHFRMTDRDTEFVGLVRIPLGGAVFEVTGKMLFRPLHGQETLQIDTDEQRQEIERYRSLQLRAMSGHERDGFKGKRRVFLADKLLAATGPLTSYDTYKEYVEFLSADLGFDPNDLMSQAVIEAEREFRNTWHIMAARLEGGDHAVSLLGKDPNFHLR